METPRVRQWLETAGARISSDMIGEGIEKGMKEPATEAGILSRAEEVALVGVAAKTGVDEVVVRIIPAGSHGTEMIHG